MKLQSLLLASALLAAPGAFAAEPETGAQRTCQTVDLRDAKGEVRFQLAGSTLLPTATGAARLELKIDKDAPLVLRVEGLVPASRIGEEYLTYVAWRVTETGGFTSLGELRPDKSKARSNAELSVKVPRGTFGLLVTAEPYFAVPRPSDTVVLEARPTVKSAKRLRPVDVACDVLPRGYYAMDRSPESLELLFASEAKTPAELLQARNAVDIAKLSGAERYSKDRLDEATRTLLRAGTELRIKGAPKQAARVASEAVVEAELARQIALQRAVDEAALTGQLETARREAAAAAAELEQVRLEGRFEAERRRMLEQRLKDEVAMREAIERRREAAIVTPPPAPQPEKSNVDQERQAVQSEIERMRSELTAERERMLNDVAKQVQTQAELERARMQLTLAEERAELRVERARLEAERQLLEQRRQRPVATPVTEPAFAEVPAADKAPVPAAAVAPAITAESAEWNRLAAEISAAREALVLEQAESRALREELRAELDAAPRDQPALPAETAADTPQPEPAEKRRWWFGRKKADTRTPPPVAPAAVTTESDLDEEWRAIQEEQARLSDERKELDAERRSLQAQSVAVQPTERRWWVGGETDGAVPAPVIVQDSGAAAERSRLDAERSQLRAETETARAGLAAERAQLEAEWALRHARQEASEKGQQIEGLDRRVAELESGATGTAPADVNPVDTKQDELAESIEQLRAELAALKTERVETAPVSSAQEPAWGFDLGKLLGAERTPRGMVVRLPDLSFEINKHELRPQAREQLARVAGILQAEPQARIEIEGHTDSIGDPAFNQRLSELRAAAVMNYLLTKNVPVEAMSARGLGDTRPVLSNDTREGRSGNRRVELIVTGDGAVSAKNETKGQ